MASKHKQIIDHSLIQLVCSISLFILFISVQVASKYFCCRLFCYTFH